MTRKDKTKIIDELTEKFQNSKFFYLTDFSTLTVEDTNDLRRLCYDKNVEIKVIKNTLIRKALERISETAYTDLYDSLKGPTAVLFAEDGKTPAVVLKEYRDTHEKPTLKAAYVDSDVIIGDDQIEFLTNLKSKEDLLGELITLLQSPAMNLVAALQSSGQTLLGLVNYGPNTVHNILTAIEKKDEN